MDKLNIPVLLGTTREKRMSIHVANFILDVLKFNSDVKSHLVDPIDYNFPGDGNDPEGKDPKYSKITQEADGFFIVTPEYNHSFPGSLKRMLDSELKNYIHKPVAFAGVSSGMFGGARAIESLVIAVREMGMVATFTDVHFPRVQEIFEESGQIKDRESYVERVNKTLDEVIWMAKALKTGRAKL